MEQDTRENEKTDDAPPHHGGAALCPHCLTPNGEADHFCRHCGTPLTAHAAIDPLGRVYAEGDTYRKAVANPRSAVVLVGMWLIFGPTALLSFLSLDFLRLPRLLGRGGVQEVLLLILSLGVWGASAAVSCAILVRVTRNYLRLRREDAGGLRSPRGFPVIVSKDDKVSGKS